MFTRIRVIWHLLTDPGCKHPRWRPAVSNRAPAKWCAECGVTVNITEAEFYALFDRPSFASSEKPTPQVTGHF